MKLFTRKHFLFLLPLLLLAQGALLASKVVRVGVYHNPPLSFVDDEGLPQGFVIDILNDIARTEGWILEFTPCEWNECLLALEDGEIDLLGPIALSEERTKRFDFSEETLITNWGQVYVQSGETDISILDLDGKKIALLEGDIHASVFQFMLEQFDINAEFLYFDEYAEVMHAIGSEGVFGGVVNHLFSMQHAHHYNVQQSSIIFNPIEVRFAATKGEHEALLSRLDTQVSMLKDDENSLYYNALSTWMQKEKEVTPKQVIWIVGGALLFLAILLGINHFLRAQIDRHTSDLAQSKEELALIMDHIPSMISYLDTDLRYIYVDQSYADWYGFNKEDVVGKLVSEVLPAKNYAKVRPNLERVVKEAREISYQHHITRYNGEEADVAISYIPHLNAKGETKAFFATVRDITKQTKAKIALRESEEQYRSLADNSLVGIYIIQKGVMLFANQGLAKLFGYERANEMQGKYVKELVAAKDWQKVQEEMRQKESGEKEISHFSFTGLRLDGSSFNAEIRSHLIPYENSTAIQGVLVDITDLVEVEERFKALSEAFFEAIYISEKGICLEQNLAAEKLFGYSLKEAIGKPGTDWIAMEDRDMVMHRMLTGYEESYRVTALRKDGSTFPAEIRARMMHYKERVVRVTGLQDITERINIERSLRESEKKFRDLFEKSKDANLIIADGKFIDFNQAAIDMLGYQNKEELLNTQPGELSPEVQPDGKNSIEKASEMIRVALEKGSHRFIWNHQRANEEVFPVEVLLTTIVLDDDQQVLHSTWKDITDRVQTENIIKVRLELAEFSFSHSLEEVLQKTLDEAEMLTKSKIGFYHFLDEDQNALSLQAWSSRTLDEHCSVENLERHYSVEKAGVWVECIKTRQPVIHNDYASLKSKQGIPEGHAEVIRQLVVPVFRQNKIVAILGVGNKATDYDQKDIEVVASLADLCWEVAERKLTENSLRESEEELQAVLEGSQAGSWDWDIQSKKIQRNENWALMLGYTLEEIEDKFDRWSELLHPDDLERVLASLDAHIEGKTSAFESEYRMQHKEGHYIWVLDRAKVTQRDTKGKALRISGVQININERVRAEEALQQHTQQLEALSKITSALSTSLQLEKLLEIILNELSIAIEFNSASIFLTEENGQVSIANAIGDAKIFAGNSYLLSKTPMIGIAETHSSLILGDVKESPHFIAWDNAPPIGGWMGIPLVTRGLRLGYLTFDSREPHAFSAKDAALAESFAPHIAHALYNARLHKEIQESNQRLETLNTVTAALSTSLTLNDVLALILEKIGIVIPFDSAAIFLIKDEFLEVAIAKGIPTEVIGEKYPLENELMKTVLQTRKPLILSDAKIDDRFEDWGNIITTRSWIGVPLITHNEIIGILTIDNNEADIYGDEHASIALPVAAQAAQAIENARLYERVIADSNEMEKRVQQRTEELQTIIDLTTDRELRMIELKEVISRLREQLEEAGHVPVADDPLNPDSYKGL